MDFSRQDMRNPLPARDELAASEHAPPRLSQGLPLPPRPYPNIRKVETRSMEYQTFSSSQSARSDGTQPAQSIDLIMDVPLQVTVELGQCKKSVKDVLGMSVGSVVVLNRLAGELVDILVNGRLIARGEVVVIDDSYGVRITDIIDTSKRLIPEA